mgnify:FL=1
MRDLKAGENAGLFFGVHVATGHGLKPSERKSSMSIDSASFKVVGTETIANLLEAEYDYLFELK